MLGAKRGATDLWDSLRKKAQKTMAKSHLAVVTPATVIGTVEPHRRPPKRVHNAEVRAREYLTNAEIDCLIKAAGANRSGHRDATMVLVAAAQRYSHRERYQFARLGAE